MRRNQRMDLYRGMAIYGVIFIHIMFPGKFGTLIRVLSLPGVPFFFLTAGFFSFTPSPETVFKRSIRAFRQLAIACIPYFLLGCWMAWYSGRGVVAWIRSLLTLQVAGNLLIFQIIPFPYAWQLWFLGTLALIYLIWFGISTIWKESIPYYLLARIALILLGLHLILGEGAGLIRLEIPVKYLRNLLLDGMPFFILGIWIAKRRKQFRTANLPWVWFTVGGMALSMIEGKLSGKQELYIGTLIALTGAMGLTIRYPKTMDLPLVRAIQFCGRELTLYIFTGHLFILGLIREFPQFYWLAEQTAILPLVIAVLSTLAAYGCYQINRYIRRRVKS